MVTRDDGIDDLEAVLAARIDFVDDQRDRGWIVGRSGDSTVYARLGNFPDEELWSLWLGHGRWMNFTVPPANWTINPSRGGWPDSARPRLPKGEFHE